MDGQVYAIAGIQRVQNKYLWKCYQQSKARLDEKNGGVINDFLG